MNNRQMRRSGGKNGFGMVGQLQSALTDLKKVTALGEHAQVVSALSEKLDAANGLVAELTELRNDLQGLRDGLRAAPKATPDRSGELELELARQRAVFLRFLFSPDILVSQGPDMVKRFLAAEQRYRDEYDAMCGLVKILSWAKEAL